MKILYYFNNLDTIMYKWQLIQIVDELNHYGWEIEIVSPNDFLSIDSANDELINRVKTGRYDMFLTCLNVKYLNISTLEFLKYKGIPTVLFCPDNLIAPYNHKEISPYFDLVWLTSIETKYLFEKWGCSNIIFLPYAANPYLKVNKLECDINRVAFVGTPYGSRTNTINYLTQNDIPVTIYGNVNTNNTKNKRYDKNSIKTFGLDLTFSIGRKILLGAAIQKMTHQSSLNDSASSIEIKGFANDLTSVYSSYALSLSSTAARNTGVLKHPVQVINLRSFEIPMCYGIQFCEYNAELANYFIEDKEIVFYRNREEMLDKARYYLDPNHDKDRQLIRVRARKRAISEHTWRHRFEAIFNKLGILAR